MRVGKVSKLACGVFLDSYGNSLLYGYDLEMNLSLV